MVKILVVIDGSHVLKKAIELAHSKSAVEAQPEPLNDLLSCEGCEGDGPHDENCKLCFTCDGTGKVRANFTDKKGRYTFHKKTCHECKGTGEAR